MKNEEIYKWLENQKYQTEYEETGKYKELAKIIADYANSIFSNER